MAGLSLPDDLLCIFRRQEIGARSVPVPRVNYDIRAGQVMIHYTDVRPGSDRSLCHITASSFSHLPASDGEIIATITISRKTDIIQS